MRTLSASKTVVAVPMLALCRLLAALLYLYVIVGTWYAVFGAAALPITYVGPTLSAILLAPLYGVMQWVNVRTCGLPTYSECKALSVEAGRMDVSGRASLLSDLLTGALVAPFTLFWQIAKRSAPLFVISAFLADTLKRQPASGVSVFLLLLLPPLAQVLWWSALRKAPSGPNYETRRGRTKKSFAEALKEQEKLLKEEAITLPWGGLRVRSNSPPHRILVGSTGSGKTANLRLLLQDALPELHLGGARAGRAIVFDPKRNFLPYLVGMGVPVDNISILHPFDKRSKAWHIAADIRNPSHATSVGTKLIFDPEKTTKDFYPGAARDVVSNVLIAFHQTCGDSWDLRDVLLAVATPDRIIRLLNRTPLTRHTLARYGGDPRTIGNISATLRKYLAPFEPIAAAWQHAPRLSLTEWVKTNSILLFGFSTEAEEQVNIINRCLFERLSELLTSQDCISKPQPTWIVLDEARKLGLLPGLSTVLLLGREFELRTVLGFQSIEGMREVYGENVAGEIVGQCKDVAIFELGTDRKTAEWAADVIGKGERLERHTSHGHGRHGTDTTTESTHERYLYLPEELQTQARTNPANGLQGKFVSEEYGVVDAAEAGIDGFTLFEKMLKPADKDTPGYIQRPDSELFLEDWTPEDLKRLGFSRDNGDDPLSRVRRL